MLLAAAVALALAGCGGGGGEAGTSPAPEDTTTPAADMGTEAVDEQEQDAGISTETEAVADPDACTEVAAVALVEGLGLGNAGAMPNPVAQVLCGEFLGPGSVAMAVSLATEGCGLSAGWVVFRQDGESWELVWESNHGAQLAAVGPDIEATVWVLREGDPHCFPSGGTRARMWSWDGERFVAGRWRQVTPPEEPGEPEPPPASDTGFFKTPSGNIVCYMSGPGADPGLVECGIVSGLDPPPPARECTDGGPVSDRVILFATGRTRVPRCAGDIGPFQGLTVGADVLEYGQTREAPGVSCMSATEGLTCRNGAGHGFFLSRGSWRRF